ncbi:MAG: flagellin-like protein [Lachnospiraceae bacterium]|nr:flagellin-like protein [Lachnospiraceae bacterium]
MFQKLDSFLFLAKYRLRAFLTDESGDVNIVSMVVLIGIAVLLAIVFRDAISNLIKTLLNTIAGNATNAVNGE